MAQLLFDAIAAHDLYVLAALLDAGADANALEATASQWRPLQAAIEALEDGGSVDAFVLLLRHGASVDARDGRGASTPLLMALFRDQPPAARILLAADADVNVVGNEGDSPLRWCAERGWHEMAALLLRCGASATVDEPGGLQSMTALGLAATRLDVEMVRLLLAHGARPSALDADRRTALDRLRGGAAGEADARLTEIRRLLGGA